MIAQTALQTPEVDWLAFAPELALFSAALLIVLLRALVRHSPRVFGWSLGLAVAGIAASGVCTWAVWDAVEEDGPYEAMAGMVAVDGFSVFLRVVVLVATLLAVLVAVRYLRREGLEGPEYLALVLLSATGMMLMVSANDLVIVFLALEILSIALYVLAAFDRRRVESQEAGLKYFLLGAFSSAVLLYGIALVYGATGTTQLTGVDGFLASTTLLDDGVLLAGMALLLVGLGFKVGAVPFHQWVPDVYEGSPTPVTTFMAAATKAAAFGAILRIFVGSFAAFALDWRPVVAALAVLSLVVGSVAALVQTDVKRMLAYSSITNAGYILIGVVAAASAGTAEVGTAAVLFYLLVYACMIAGSFAVVTLVARRGDERHALADYRGLGAREPMLAGLLTWFLLAQAGVPLTGGFVAKLTIFSAGIDAGQYWLVLVGVIVAVVSAFVYLRIVVTMYAADDGPPEESAGPIRIDVASGTALFVAATALLLIGVLPNVFLDFARDATLLVAGG